MSMQPLDTTARFKLSCGACGKSQFTVFAEAGKLKVQCVACNSVTTVQVRAELDYREWEGDGGLCRMGEP